MSGLTGQQMSKCIHSKEAEIKAVLFAKRQVFRIPWQYAYPARDPLRKSGQPTGTSLAHSLGWLDAIHGIASCGQTRQNAPGAASDLQDRRSAQVGLYY